MPRARVQPIDPRVVLIALLSAVAWSGPVRAGSALELGWMSTTDRSDAGNSVTFAARFGPMRPRATGAELGLGTYGGFKGNTEAGWLGIWLDLDLAHTAVLAGPVSWSSRIGTTLLTGVAEGGGGLAGGFNAGVGILAIPTSGVGARVDLGYRVVYSRGSTGLWTASLGIVWPGKDANATRE